MRTARTIVCALICALTGAAVAADLARDRRLGVATCAGSACHGAVRLSGGAVRQDEYLLWQRKDRHSRAYATLRNERSQAIARKLGLGEAAQARECLVCHSDRVPSEQRGERYQQSDGVACETCHGGAERWLNPHVRGYANHRQRLADGLYPTWEPGARAELCLSCHQGSAQRPMTHTLLGAGHPPLLFELDTFGALQPAHFDMDADYRARKNPPDNVRLWAVGQAVAARGLLSGLAQTSGDQTFAELVWFDCNACHHSVNAVRWEPGIVPELPPGRPRLADTSLYFVGLWLGQFKPELAARWRDGVKNLHQASLKSAGDLREAAQAVQELLVKEVLPLMERQAHDRAGLRALALSLLDRVSDARAADFSTAEQTAMALAVLVTGLERAGAGGTPKALSAAVNGVYQAVAKRDSYDPEAMRRALRAAREQIAKTYP